MSRAWVTGPQGKLGVAAATLLLAAVAFLCLADGDPTDHGPSMAWCAGAVVLSLLAIWLVGPSPTGRVLAHTILSAYPITLHLLDPPPKLAIS
jgi:hypothetical protein